MATLTPAYGRDYKSKAEAEADFRAGKDFIYNQYGDRYDGKPCSIRDFEEGSQHQIRYQKNTKVFIVKI